MRIVLIIGVILLILSSYIFYSIGRKDLIKTKEENLGTIGFFVTYTGIWLILIAVLLWIMEKITFPVYLNMIIGAAFGVVPGLFNLYYWVEWPGESRLAHKYTPEESIGAAGIGGCGAVFSVFLGALLGIVI